MNGNLIAGRRQFFRDHVTDAWSRRSCDECNTLLVFLNGSALDI